MLASPAQSNQAMNNRSSSRENRDDGLMMELRTNILGQIGMPPPME
jgi:hypothetical protein